MTVIRNSILGMALSLILVTATIVSAQPAAASPKGATLFPVDKATGVNPDTHLIMTFPSAPALGKTGQIRIYDAADNKLVDMLDLSIPAGPDPKGPRPPTTTLPAAEAAARAAQAQARAATPLGHATNATAVAGTTANFHNPSHEYQLTIIGGVQQGFHFYPIIIHGNVATIYPHNNLLDYRRTYRVEIDPGVLTLADGTFKGISGASGWTFTTKTAPPSADSMRLVVAPDGSGDFNTVQGALDFVPDKPAQRVTIFIKNGTYEEIVFFHDKANLTIRGEDREKVQVGYGNNSVFNPPAQADADGHVLGGPSRRCAFACYNANDVILSNFTVSNYYRGQAEGLLVSGSRNIVSLVTIIGSGDALNLRGPVYFTDCKIAGDGDTILNVGPAFFYRCQLSSYGPYMWVRNPATNHGDVFVECTFETPPGPNPLLNRPTNPVLARLPNNHGINYPYAEAVLINCRLAGIPPAGWGPIDDDTSNVKFWEYNSTNLSDGKPVDVSKRHPVSRQLTKDKDAETIANYSKPAYILGGWTPVLP